ncbi:excinuclease ABC subunit UvrC [Ferruginibacter sp. HRS2-29]|uniref:excinuclease ABC subunit UvrC n=1 Tax=Ferruginibacter sp. HRS2-29 TaxID=2487334 RepID=UPI0020CF5385|nr:excinuclease ABC subunit UvrC [Ferruginibacter sp. HRS2-29]MCP9751721.1 excinuclease ABC subunit C [Ferruginibacter sp. HRS2-29]
MTAEQFSAISSTIPAAPGIYKYFDASGKIIYVGKAKHLRKRVSSYFARNKTNYKTIELVHRISKIEFTIVNNEHDAFLLENTLIKEHQPQFNIDLKDDKSYPYIVVKNEAFPRIFLTRRKIKDGSQYFGPYTSVAKVRDLLNFIKQNIQLRTCKLNLTDSNIKKNKFKVCLEYHLGNCKGPCEGLQSAEDYNDGLLQLKSLLKGNISPVLQNFKTRQKVHIEKMEFEKAAFYQSKIEHLQQYQSRSSVVNTNTGTVDVFSIIEEGDTAYVNYLAVSNGSIIQTKTITLEKKLDESPEEVLAFAIIQLRQVFESEATEIIVPMPLDYAEPGITVTVPKAGDKKRLLDLSEKNVNYFTEELKAKKILRLEGKTTDEKMKVLEQLQEDLHLSALPVHIECFDNSNFQGSYPVAAMVCFKNGEPSKKDYRHFNIKTVEGINDFASMSEVVYRRYKRVLEENAPLPQLIIIDGGKGQLSAAMQSIDELDLRGKVTLVGLAKNEEELFYAGDTSSLKLAWDSESLKLIRRIRDEVHRFGITFHRNKRSKGTFKNELEGIKGIGKETASMLLKMFKSVKKIKEADTAEIEKLIGKSKTLILKEGLKVE